MAKTPKLKYKVSANPRSRASKRATSPSIDLDKSLKTTPHNETVSQPVLAARLGAGITKKKSKRGSAKTRGQKIRQERGLQRAEAVMDQLEKKVEEAREREGKMRERRKMWEEVNSGVKGVVKTAKSNVNVGDAPEWEDVEDVDGDRDGDQQMKGYDGAEASTESTAGVVETAAPAKAGVFNEEGVEVADPTTSLNGIELEDEIT